MQASEVEFGWILSGIWKRRSIVKRRTLIAVILFAWFVTGAFTSPSRLASGAPIIWQEDVEDVFVTGFCGFPMEVRTTGTGVFHLFLDENGNFERIIITAPTVKIVFTNLNTGESVWTPSVNMVEQRMNEDGTGTLTYKGLLWHLVVPGEGLVTADVGRIDWLFTFDDEGSVVSEELVFAAGIQENQLPPMLCSVLG
jgi:hypothetical protein